MKMKTKLSVALLLTFFGFSQLASADESQTLSQSEVDQIKATCKEDSHDAINPELYVEQCVSEMTQSLKEEKGIVDSEKQ